MKNIEIPVYKTNEKSNANKYVYFFVCFDIIKVLKQYWRFGR